MKMMSMKQKLHKYWYALFLVHTMCCATGHMNRILTPLQKIFMCLHTSIECGTDISVCYQDAPPELIVTTSNIHFEHPRISACESAIAQSGSIDPLLELWKEHHFTSTLSYDDLFLREFLILVYCHASQCALYGACPHDPHARAIMDKLKEIYHKLDALPMEEILNAIELLSEEFPYLLEKYEFHSTSTWKQWLKKYWWAPPLIIGTLLLKLWVQHIVWKRMNAFTQYHPPLYPHQGSSHESHEELSGNSFNHQIRPKPSPDHQ